VIGTNYSNVLSALVNYLSLSCVQRAANLLVVTVWRNGLQKQGNSAHTAAAI